MKMEILMGDEIRLRSISIEEDIVNAIQWYHDPEVLYYSEGVGMAPYDEITIRRMYSTLSAMGYVYIIEIKEKNTWKPIGDAALARITIPIVIGSPEYRSRGIGKKVLSLLIAKARDMGWKELSVKGIFSYNERSLNLYTAAGFVESERTPGNGCENIHMILKL